MTTYTHSITVKGVSAADIWNVWTEVNEWPQWQDDLEAATLVGAMATGKSFTLRPKGGPLVRLQVLNVDSGRNFTDLTRFPLAEMRASHDIIEQPDGSLQLSVAITVSGPLAFLWTRLVVNGIVRGQDAQLRALVQRARQAQAVAA